MQSDSSKLEEIFSLISELDEERRKIVSDYLVSLEKNIHERKEIDDKLIQSKSNSKIVCPKCRSIEVRKFGKRNNHQRYRCNSCNHVFTETSTNALKATKLSTFKWYEYADLFNYRFTLRNIAKRLKVSINTAFLMRHKILNALQFFQFSYVLKDNVFADELYFRRNNKDGSKITFRDFRKHGGDNIGVEIKRLNTIIVLMIFDNNYHLVLQRLKSGTNKTPQMDKQFRKRIKNGATLYTDGYRHYKSVADLFDGLNIANKAIKGQYTKELDHINNVSSYVQAFFSRFNGVATKYLQRYLNWCCFTYYYEHQKEDYKELIVKLLMILINSKSHITRKNIGKKKYIK